jgi:pyrimidine deaminase RibD-like protein
VTYDALMRRAFALSQKSPPSSTAFAVGAIACDENLNVLAEGYSRETGAFDHAEEVVLAKLQAAGLTAHTLICTLEPCLHRQSKPQGCAELVERAGVKTVVYAVAEDDTFVRQGGLAYLDEHGVELVHLSGYEDAFKAANAGLYSK